MLWKNIAGTTGSKILIAAINLGLVVLNARYLGAEGLGTLSLIVLAISIFMLLNNLAGGAAIIYLRSKYPLSDLLLFSYSWAFASMIIFGSFMLILPIAPSGYMLEVLGLCALQAILSIHHHALLGSERVMEYNFLTLIQSIMQIALVVCFYIGLGRAEVEDYLIVLGIAFALMVLWSTYLVYAKERITKPGNWLRIWDAVLRYGLYVQGANILQLLNYRLSYYILEYFSGRASLGRYSVGVQLSEGMWIVSRSMSTVQYARIAKLGSGLESVKLTFTLARLSMLVTALMWLAVLAIPADLFVWIFGEDFFGVKPIILAMGLGIISLATSNMFAHYFSGIGKPHINTLASGIGLVLTLIAGLILIPKMGAVGAAWTASISYFSILIFNSILILFEEGASLSLLLNPSEDIRSLKRILKKGED